MPAPEYQGTGIYRAPGSVVEEVLAGIFAEVLGVQRVGVDDSFFDLGGDSLSAMRLVAAINTALGTQIAVRTLFSTPTVSGLCEQLGRHDSSVEVVPVEMLKEGTGVPLCCIHDGLGLSWSYRALGDYLDCPIIGINQTTQTGEAEPESIRAMAASYADRLQAFYPAGRYKLLGWSLGGVVAHELAIELRRRGCLVEHLVLIDAVLANDGVSPTQHAGDENRVLEHMLLASGLDTSGHPGPLTYSGAAEMIRRRLELSDFALPSKQLLEFMVQSVTKNQLYLFEHVPDVFDGDMVVFSAARILDGQGSSDEGIWWPYVTGEVSAYSVDCTHYEMLTAEPLSTYGAQLKRVLET